MIGLSPSRPGCFQAPAGGARPGGDRVVRIECEKHRGVPPALGVDGAPAVLFECDVRPTMALFGGNVLIDPAPPRGGGVVDQVLALLCPDVSGEARGAVSGEQLVREPFQHRARDGDRMQVALERAHRSGAPRVAVHDRRVELDLTNDVRPAAAPHGTYALIGFDEANPRLDGVRWRARPPRALVRCTRHPAILHCW